MRRLSILFIALTLVVSSFVSAPAPKVEAHGQIVSIYASCLAYVSYYRWGAVNAYQLFYYADGHVEYVHLWLQGCPGTRY